MNESMTQVEGRRIVRDLFLHALAGKAIESSHIEQVKEICETLPRLGWHYLNVVEALQSVAGHRKAVQTGLTEQAVKRWREAKDGAALAKSAFDELEKQVKHAAGELRKHQPQYSFSTGELIHEGNPEAAGDWVAKLLSLKAEREKAHTKVLELQKQQHEIELALEIRPIAYRLHKWGELYGVPEIGKGIDQPEALYTKQRSLKKKFPSRVPKPAPDPTLNRLEKMIYRREANREPTIRELQERIEQLEEALAEAGAGVAKPRKS